MLDDITVVIPTLGRDILEESLHRIAAGSHWPGEVIVVDQGNRAQVSAWIADLQAAGLRARYVPSSRRGKAAALNEGIGLADTTYIAVTDDDCFVQANWLDAMYRLLHRHPTSVVTGPAIAAGEEDSVASVTVDVQVVSTKPSPKFDLFCGSNMGTAKSTMALIGPFDDDLCLIAAEDIEWAYRTLRRGVPILYSPEMVVHHFSWRDLGQRGRRYQDYARSIGGFYGKYLRRGDWFVGLRALIHLARAFRRWLWGMVVGDTEAALHGRSYVTGLMPGMVAGFRSRKSP